MTTFNGLVHKDLNISTMDSRKLSSFKKMHKQIAKKTRSQNANANSRVLNNEIIFAKSLIFMHPLYKI